MLVAAAVVVIATVRGGEADGEPPSRPSGPVGEWVQIVGGGDIPLTDVDDEPVPATDVYTGDAIAAMAAEADGTVWLLDPEGRVYRADPDGTIQQAAFGEAPSAEDGATVEIGPDGALYVVTDLSNSVSRIEPQQAGARWAHQEIVGAEGDVFNSLALGDDGSAYVADNEGRVYSLAVESWEGGGGDDHLAQATRLDGTPPDSDRCPLVVEGRQARRISTTGMAVDHADDLVIADPFCDWIYRPGTEPSSGPPPSNCPGNAEQGDAGPGDVVARGDSLIVVGAYCRTAWGVAADGMVDVLVESSDLVVSDHSAHAAIDRSGTLYVSDGTSVYSARLPDGR